MTPDPNRIVGAILLLYPVHASASLVQVNWPADVLVGAVVFFVGAALFRMKFVGGGDVKLSAPTEDPTGADGFSGVLFYQDRNVSSSSSKSNFFNGGAELDLEGALYFPEQALDFAGGADVGDGCTQLVAKTVSIAGEANLETNCNDAGTREIGRFKATLGE